MGKKYNLHLLMKPALAQLRALLHASLALLVGSPETMAIDNPITVESRDMSKLSASESSQKENSNKRCLDEETCPFDLSGLDDITLYKPLYLAAAPANKAWR